MCSLGAAAGLALAPALYQQEKKHLAALEEVGTGPSYHPAASLPFASINPLTLAVAVEPTTEDVEKEPVTGLEFPKLISSQKPCCRGKGPFKGLTLSGLGVRSKRLLGLANIRVYAFGTPAVLALPSHCLASFNSVMGLLKQGFQHGIRCRRIGEPMSMAPFSFFVRDCRSTALCVQACTWTPRL